MIYNVMGGNKEDCLCVCTCEKKEEGLLVTVSMKIKSSAKMTEKFRQSMECIIHSDVISLATKMSQQEHYWTTNSRQTSL